MPSKSLFLCFFTLALILVGCSSSNPAAPITETTLAQALAATSDVPPDDSAQVPPDCYAWGKQLFINDWQNDLDYHALQPWIQAVTLHQTDPVSADGTVTVDWMLFIEKDQVSGQETAIAFISYEDVALARQLTTNEGGLYSRFYVNNDFSALTNSLISDGVLKVSVGLYPDKVSHWWMNASGKYERRPNCSYYFKCRLKTSGTVVVQIATDFYKETTSNYPDNKEANHSPWFSTGGVYKVICWPPGQ